MQEWYLQISLRLEAKQKWLGHWLLRVKSGPGKGLDTCEELLLSRQLIASSGGARMVKIVQNHDHTIDCTPRGNLCLDGWHI
jgi:hypothetical protein